MVFVREIQSSLGDRLAGLPIGMASLADGGMRQSESIDNSVDKFLDTYVSGKVKTGTTPTANSVVKVYVYGSIDGGGNFSGGASGSDAAFTGEEEQLFLLGTVVVDGTNDKSYKFGPFSVLDAFRGLSMPEKWGIIVKNETGAALNATAADQLVKTRGIKAEQVA